MRCSEAIPQVNALNILGGGGIKHDLQRPLSSIRAKVLD